jgi:hypothetical protein
VGKDAGTSISNSNLEKLEVPAFPTLEILPQRFKTPSPPREILIGCPHILIKADVSGASLRHVISQTPSMVKSILKYFVESFV